jgi:predicted RNase H-like HicB family nuclease
MSEQKYRIIIGFDPEKECYVARAPELEECRVEAETAEAALVALNEEIEAQIDNIQAAGGKIPMPLVEETFSGEVTIKISKTTHRELAWVARLEELPEEQIASELFQAALAYRLSQRPRQGRPNAQGGNRSDSQGQKGDSRGRGRARQGGGRGPGQGRYHEIMDDRANFIEYVRGLENAGGRHSKGPRKRR